MRKFVEIVRFYVFTCVCVCVCVCVYCQYINFSFYQILYNLSFIITILEKIPEVVIVENIIIL